MKELSIGKFVLQTNKTRTGLKVSVFDEHEFFPWLRRLGFGYVDDPFSAYMVYRHKGRTWRLTERDAWLSLRLFLEQIPIKDAHQGISRQEFIDTFGRPYFTRSQIKPIRKHLSTTLTDKEKKDIISGQVVPAEVLLDAYEKMK